MPDSIVKETLREIEPLQRDDPVGHAAAASSRRTSRRCPWSTATAASSGSSASASSWRRCFPPTSGRSPRRAMVSRSIDDTIERRESCRDEPIRDHLTTDHVLVEDDYSDIQLAELFLHHRVLIIPIATAGRVHAVVTRNDFFRALAAKLG